MTGASIPPRAKECSWPRHGITPSCVAADIWSGRGLTPSNVFGTTLQDLPRFARSLESSQMLVAVSAVVVGIFSIASPPWSLRLPTASPPPFTPPLEKAELRGKGRSRFLEMICKNSRTGVLPAPGSCKSRSASPAAPKGIEWGGIGNPYLQWMTSHIAVTFMH